jgi:nicotinamidase/pyrazinamidase
MTSIDTIIPSTEKATLLLIDIQNDFHPGGSLAIPSANDDAIRISTFIRTNATKIHRIVATMDTHPKLHIAHPEFWINTVNGSNPDPFTIITTADIQSGIWKPRPDLQIPISYLDENVFDIDRSVSDSSVVNNSNNKCNMVTDLERYCLEYTTRLEQSGKFQLCIWPEHCLMGTAGHAIVDIVQRALHDWTTTTGRNVEYIFKGQNPLTEMYSVMAAEVPITVDTTFNTELQHSLMTNHTSLIIAGQAMSHCVNYSVRDIVRNWTSNQNDTTNQSTTTIPTMNIYLLTDCCSAVPGFEDSANEFLNDMRKIPGMHLIQSTEFE